MRKYCRLAPLFRAKVKKIPLFYPPERDTRLKVCVLLGQGAFLGMQPDKIAREISLVKPASGNQQKQMKESFPTPSRE
jgi:hypothetical protein